MTKRAFINEILKAHLCKVILEAGHLPPDLTPDLELDNLLPPDGLEVEAVGLPGLPWIEKRRLADWRRGKLPGPGMAVAP